MRGDIEKERKEAIHQDNILTHDNDVEINHDEWKRNEHLHNQPEYNIKGTMKSASK